MSKEIKCKKCGLTYSKKNRECPYCHKKRATTHPIIIIAIIAVAVGVLIACSNLLNPKVKYIDGLKVEIINYTEDENILTQMTDESQVRVTLEITNVSNAEKSLNFDIVTYADDYLANNSWLFSSTNVDVENLIPGKKCTHEIIVNPKKDWEKIEFYYSKNTNTTGKENYKQLYVITNDKE